MSLPLKLNAFERYMWLDDRPSHPMACFTRIAFSGKFDQAVFVAALQKTLPRHPLLHAQVADEPGRALTWIAASEVLPYLDCADADAPLRFPATYQIDLRRETGLRIWARTRDTGGTLLFQFHHACCDGVGAHQFLEDLLCLYDHLAHGRGGAPAGLRPIDLTDLPRRNRFGANWLDWLGRRVVDFWGLVAGIPFFFLIHPVPLAAPDPPAPGTVDELTVPEILIQRFTHSQFAALRARAQSLQATLNDLLLREFFLALGAWNAQHDPDLQRQEVRVMIPFNLRGPEHSRLPAVNVVGMANLDRTLQRPGKTDPQRLLRGLKWELQFYKACRMVTSFPCILAALERLPGGLRRIFGSDRCLATAVLSNLGRLWADGPLPRRDGRVVVGDLTLTSVDPAPPVRAGSSITCTLYTYANELALSVNYDRHRFSRRTAEKLLRHLVAQLEQTMGP